MDSDSLQSISLFSETTQLLKVYYKTDFTNGHLPASRQRSKWMPENKLGFLLGIIIGYVTNEHITELHNLLHSDQFKGKEDAFIDRMFDCYIRPFNKSYSVSSSRNTTPTTSKLPSRKNSRDDVEYVEMPKCPTNEYFRNSVMERDTVCLFCWNTIQCEGAHIISNKNVIIAYQEQSILTRAGLDHINHVQNGLFLCSVCHGEFDQLLRYVDVVDDKLVVKVVNKSQGSSTRDEYSIWVHLVEDLKIARYGRQGRWADNRQVVEPNGEMALCFVQNDAAKLPNRVALEYHKAACLIWKMAGGAEPVEDYSDDDDTVDPVDTAALKRRFNIQDPDATLNPVEL